MANDLDRNELLSRRAAMMAAAGKPDETIIRSLGIDASVLNVYKSSPLWQQMVQTYNEEIEERGIQGVVDDIVADAPKNIQFIKQVRDGVVNDPKDRLDMRLRAAKMLLDKQAPNADIRAQNESAARIIMDGKLLGQVLHAMRDVGVLDVTPAAIDKATGNQDVAKLLGAKSPEQFAKDYVPPDPEDE